MYLENMSAVSNFLDAHPWVVSVLLAVVSIYLGIKQLKLRLEQEKPFLYFSLGTIEFGFAAEQPKIALFATNTGRSTAQDIKFRVDEFNKEYSFNFLFPARTEYVVLQDIGERTEPTLASKEVHIKGITCTDTNRKKIKQKDQVIPMPTHLQA